MQDRNTMNLILVLIGAFLAVFTVGMVFVYILTGGIPDTLVTCVFAVCGGECGVMGWIKTTKDKHRVRQWQIEDRENGAKTNCAVGVFDSTTGEYGETETIVE